MAVEGREKGEQDLIFLPSSLNSAGQVQAVTEGTVTSFNGGQAYVGSSPLVTTEAVEATDSFSGGLRYRADGALRVVDSAGSFYASGVAVTAAGQLCISTDEPSGTATAGGVATTADGRVFMSGVGGGGYVGPLDLVPGAVVSLDQFAPSGVYLNTPYATIRKSGGSSIAFNFDSATGEQPISQILTHLDGSDGFLPEWNSGVITASQATTTKQMQWLSAQYGIVPSPVGDVFDDTFLGTPIISFPSASITLIFVGKYTGVPGTVTIAGINDQFGDPENPCFLIFGFDITNDPLGKVRIDAGDAFGEIGGVSVETSISGQPHIIVARAAPGQRSFRVDGNVIAVDAPTDFGLAEEVHGEMAIGAGDVLAATANFTGPYGALYAYPSYLSDEDVGLLETLFSERYGITLGE